MTHPTYYFRKLSPHGLVIQHETITTPIDSYFTDEIEILYVISGEGTATINNVAVDIHPGSFSFCFPYHIRSITPNKHSSIEIIRCTFSLGLLLLSVNNTHIYHDIINSLQVYHPIVLLDQNDQQDVRYFIDEIDFEKKTTQEVHYLLNISLVSYLSYVYIKYLNNTSQNKTIHDTTWKSLQFIHVYHQQSLTLETVSHALNISTDVINRGFKDLTGFSFSETLNQVRVRNAVALMQFTDLSCNQIGIICGYKTEANFYKQFKQIYNRTPLAYRKENASWSNNSVELWEVTDTLLQLCTQPLQLENFCALVSYSEEKVNDILYKNYKRKFKQLLNDFRVNIGHIMLATSQLPIAEIAQNVGFQNSNSFCRSYKQFYHTTPNDFRKKLNQSTNLTGGLYV